MVDNLTLSDHRKLVVHSVARWLEQTYTPQISLDSIHAQVRFDTNDFDPDLNKQSSTNLENELKVLKAILSSLRGGKLQEIQ